jgi:hypothetical protein
LASLRSCILGLDLLSTLVIPSHPHASSRCLPGTEESGAIHPCSSPQSQASAPTSYARTKAALANCCRLARNRRKAKGLNSKLPGAATDPSDAAFQQYQESVGPNPPNILFLLRDHLSPSLILPRKIPRDALGIKHGFGKHQKCRRRRLPSPWIHGRCQIYGNRHRSTRDEHLGEDAGAAGENAPVPIIQPPALT